MGNGIAEGPGKKKAIQDLTTNLTICKDVVQDSWFHSHEMQCDSKGKLCGSCILFFLRIRLL